MIKQNGKRYYSTRDISDIIGKTPRAIAHYIRRNKIGARKINNNWYITRREFARFCKGREFIVSKTAEERGRESEDYPCPGYWFRPGHLCLGLLSQGSSLTINEWRGALWRYTRTRKDKRMDQSIIPYLDRINFSGVIMTLMSCCCGKNDYSRPKPHIAFRSCLDPTETIEKVLQPMFRDNEISTDVQLELDASDTFGLLYIFRFPKRIWKKSLAKIVKVLGGFKIQRYKTKNKIFKGWMYE